MSDPDDAVPAQAGLDIIISSVSSDAHTWNLVFLQLLLQEWGHRTTNLGPCVPEELLAEECARRRPDLVVVSTVNGHGFHDGLRLIRTIRRSADTARLPVVIGGKLGLTAGEGAVERTGRLVAAGYRAVFDADAAITGGPAEPAAAGLLRATDHLRSFRAFVDSLAATVPC
ncbi:cobalamin-dependent protein [Micromonospora sp. WMMD882]|uniref:cobalamin B12-binding domain-containing protein n=1 Tax=Micromonospora sp. WMMD882 TaxID=3015151 RepID=UPI00248CF05C|nr:cobalamin-dependent protein [Micromonospora sp. WMMD882]WBB80963.1 cobalamin-dependent protein [Micromonospora sp. WMMD882]